MKHRLPLLLCIFTFTALLCCSLQQWTHLFPVKPLSGAVPETELAKPTFEGLRTGEWQGLAEQHLKSHFGFREWGIRLRNQFLWTLFHRSTVETVIPGKEGYLYERYFVEDWYESRMYKYTDSPEELLRRFDLEASRLAKIQAILEENGVHLFVLIEPGKESVYPEFLPDRDTMTRAKGPTAIDCYPPLFQKYGVRYIDMNRHLCSLKDSVPWQIMPQHGTHWSNIAATYAFDSVVNFMELIGRTRIADFSFCAPYADRSRHPDRDLEELLNLAFPMRTRQDLYTAPTIDSVYSRPRLIVIGDSFFWNIIYSYPLEKIFDWHYWFYNSTEYAYGYEGRVADRDLVDELAKSDFVMLAHCTSQLYDLGNGFTTQALLHLCYSHDQIDSTLDAITQAMRNTPEWLSNLQSKAQEQGRTLEEMMSIDAEYLLFTTPEDYLPELRGSGLPRSRNPKLRKL